MDARRKIRFDWIEKQNKKRKNWRERRETERTARAKRSGFYVCACGRFYHKNQVEEFYKDSCPVCRRSWAVKPN